MTISPTATSVAPQVLLGNHLKALKLPTFLREYEKSWLGKIEQGDKWSFCLMAAMMACEQERR